MFKVCAKCNCGCNTVKAFFKLNDWIIVLIYNFNNLTTICISRYQKFQYSSSNLYRYNGKEEQQIAGTELAVLDYGARTYDPWLSRWTSIDPLAAKYHSTSPYVFCSNSPVNFVDPWGMDIYIFRNGVFSHSVTEDNTHRIANITYDDDNNMVVNYYDFADPINDPLLIDSGKITNINFISEQQVYNMLERQGAFNTTTNVMTFVKNSNSLSVDLSSSFDYTNSELAHLCDVNKIDGETQSKYLFITEGETTAHNIMNYGNYLWGVTGYTYGIPLFVLKIGAHLNSLGFFGKIGTRSYNGYTPQFDSEDDQKSIKEGFEYAKQNSYRQHR